MKNTTAHNLAMLTIDWTDARSARIAARRARNGKAQEFHLDNGSSKQDEHYQEEFEAYTLAEQQAYRTATKIEVAARNRLNVAVKRAKQELEE